MSEFVQRLRQQARELDALERDLRVRPKGRVDWTRTTMSSTVAGLGTPVEQSFLADYSLTTWTEWRSLYHRYPHYFGRPEELLPHRWHKTAFRCEHLAEQLFQDAALGDVLTVVWSGEDQVDNPANSPDAAARTEAAVFYRRMVRNHLRLSALAGGEADLRADYGPWGRCALVARKADEQTKRQFTQAAAPIREAVVWHLRHYRHANLEVSWLNGAPRMTLMNLLQQD
jgi:hypothetical protein